MGQTILSIIDSQVSLLAHSAQELLSILLLTVSHMDKKFSLQMMETAVLDVKCSEFTVRKLRL